ncbi:hypothetical protein BJX63DRAFT_436445 [Aspergillus granulosus]|uniref:DUF3885 domain-containing protein n=1 Tax=Aspergillus granulosus TaxID=176169 RepID=A0ABR4GYR6_9EURO
MLRTYYGNGKEGDRKFIEYTQVSDDYDGHADCFALNNPELFNFGSDWRRIFEILPEIAGCKGHYTRLPNQEILDEKYAGLAKEIRNCKAEYPNWKEDPDILLEPGDTTVRSLLRTTTISWIIIVDERTFETDELLIVYLDKNQNVTVEGRLELDQGYIDELLLRWEDGYRPLGIVMENGTVGEKYRLSNESGRRFFRLTNDLEYKADDARPSEGEE